MKSIGLFIGFFIYFYMSISEGSTFTAKTEYQVCFTPYQNCMKKIVRLINHAKKSIFIQAYSFTAHPIAKALVRAKERGVEVRIIFDKSNFSGHFYSSSKYLIRHGIPSWNDSNLNIAHNKVIIVDQSIVQTGSFNYTYSAQKHNAENVLIIYNRKLAQRYLDNWYRRRAVSEPVK